MRTRIGSCLVAVVSLTMASAQAVQVAPEVVTTILPIHSLVSGVMEGVSKPVLLLKGGASPHTYSLRPSDARALQRADIVVWVGEDLESSFAKPIQTLSKKSTVLSLMSAPGVKLIRVREGGAWEETPDAEHKHDHDHDHERGRFDLHIWLDPNNAKSIVRAVAAALTRIDSTNAGTYRKNAARVIVHLEAMEQRIRDQLAPVKGRPYLVFHDGYHYFEKHFGTNGVGAVTVSPERAPGAKRIAELRARLGQFQAACIFAEPQFRPNIIRVISAGTGARTATLDPLGATLTPGPDAYFRLMENLAVSMRGCLASPS